MSPIWILLAMAVAVSGGFAQRHSSTLNPRRPIPPRGPSPDQISDNREVADEQGVNVEQEVQSNRPSVILNIFNNGPGGPQVSTLADVARLMGSLQSGPSQANSQVAERASPNEIALRAPFGPMKG